MRKWFQACVVIAAIAFVAGYLCGRPRTGRTPPIPAFVVETIPKTDTTIIVRRTRDARAERELQRLCSQLAERHGIITRLTADIRNLEARLRLVTDSATNAELQRRGGILLVSFDRGALQVWSARDGVLAQWHGRADRNRWRLWLGEDGARVQQTRFPPIGVRVFARLTLPYDTLSLRTPTVGVGIFVRTRPLTWHLGLSGRREIEAGFELGIEL